MNLRPPSVTASTQTSAFNAIVFQSPVMPNARMSLCTQSVHSFSFPPRPLRTALKVSARVFGFRRWSYQMYVWHLTTGSKYIPGTTVVLLLLCCRRALLLLSAPVILMMKQLPSDTPETMQQRAFAVCCTRCTCPCLHAWVVFHRL